MENNIKVFVDTEVIYADLEKWIPQAYEELKVNTECKVVRFLFNNEDGHIYPEYNQDYLFRPSEQWKFITAVNKELLDMIYERDDVDRFVSSKILQWVAGMISRTYCKLEFTVQPAFEEERFKELLRSVHSPKPQKDEKIIE